jgi:predicted secreted protein
MAQTMTSRVFGLMIPIETISKVSITSAIIIKIGGMVIIKMDVIVIVIALLVTFMGGVLIGAQTLGKTTDQPSQNTLNTTSFNDILNGDIRCYGLMENNTTVTALKDSLFMIILEENPTTGYNWSVSHTDGLYIAADIFMPSNPELAGAGGIHVWSVMATGCGDQSFNATYGRTWENTTAGNYTLNVQVLGSGEDLASSALSH